MLKKIGIALAVLIVGFLVVVQLQPGEFRIERSAEIGAPPAVVYPMLTDFRAWNTWSPWEKLDPSMKKTFSGPPVGKGAVYEWSGNDDVGSGRMQIMDVRDNEQVTIKLDFLAPFEASNTTQFTLVPKGSSSTLTWSMTGKNSFTGKAFSLFMNMDEMVGADFEKGLNALKARAEAQAQASK